MPPLVPLVALAAYAFLLGLGGIIGYRRAGSRPSLIAGLISAVVALMALGVSVLGPPKAGYGLGLALSFLLLAFFTRRFTQTRKFMPAGLMALTSLVVIILLSGALLRA